MRLRAGCDLRIEAAVDCPCVAMLRPRSGVAQWLAYERYAFDPPLHPAEYLDSYGNLCQRFVAPRGAMRIRVEAVVETEEQIAVDLQALPTPVELLPDEAMQFLLQSRYCPSDRMMDRALAIVDGIAPGYAQVEAIRRWIHDHLEYRYGVSDAATDALDTLEHGAGVCRDFAHVGIGLARSLRLPARMVVGYLYQLDPMDLHAWFEVYLDGRWYTFDATQAEPRGGRIVIAYGRDAADVAFLSNYGPLETTGMEVWVGLDDGEA